jgi:hypothetical protein
MNDTTLLFQEFNVLLSGMVRDGPVLSLIAVKEKDAAGLPKRVFLIRLLSLRAHLQARDYFATQCFNLFVVRR